VDLYTTLDQSDRAIALALDYLRQEGTDWSPHPTDEDVRREYERIYSQLGTREIEDLITLPLANDAASLATLDVLAKIGPPSYFTEPNLYALAICRAVNISIEHGNSDPSCDAYVRLGLIAGDRFDEYKAGSRFGNVGYELVEQGGFKRFQARTYMLFGAHLLPCTRHVRTGCELLRRAFDIANTNGDVSFAAYSCFNLVESLLAAGEPLVEVEREVKHALEYAESIHFGYATHIICSDLGLVRTLRGLTRKFGLFDSENLDEHRIEEHFSSNPNLEMAASWYWIRKLQARFHAGEYASAVHAATQALQAPSLLKLLCIGADFHFYGALSHAASCGSAAAGERQQHIDALFAHHKQLQAWAANCPENFENCAMLIGAEIARIEGRELDAERLYERAIRSASDNDFIHNEALANELAARFYAARGFEKIAKTYLRDARYGYLRWGADGKVRQLDERYPLLREAEPALDPTSTIRTPVEHLDLATVIKVSQVVSSEIVLERLLDTLMRTAMAQAGAERALLILARGDVQHIAAEATNSGDATIVHLRDEPVAAAALPESVLHYVLRTRESVILHDAAAQSSFGQDPYIGQRQARSVLCLPLLNHAKLIGVLYLENNLAPRVFAPARITVLKLLASQAAISLENTRLYRDLAQREAKIRRLVDANIIGIFIRSIPGEVDGPIVEANDAFLRIVGYDREDLISGRINWANLSPPEWQEIDARAVAELKRTGIVPTYEKEYLRKDGTRVPVLVGAATLENGTDGVAFVLDLSKRKRAEAEARDSERRYRQVQAELAHANRVAAMGQLTASIAHEIRQPLAAVKMSGNAALHWLTRDPFEIDEVSRAIEGIIKDADRANEVIGRIHNLVRKAAPSRDALEINEAILEVVALTRAEAARQGVTVLTQLADHLPQIRGDRVQLQQVMINLIINAIQAMGGVEGAREIHVSTACEGFEAVRVAVQDSGPGVSPEKLPHLFEPFYTTKTGGMGMGLSISRSIIEDHGGRLWASEDAPKGALFQFTLPVGRPA
jgi:PAS domain S-box-containing protein